MSYSDKKFGDIFPTRTGVVSGTANERKMLDAIGGSDSFRTRIETAADGTETMLRTKNGQPQFSTSSKQSVVETTAPAKGRTFVFADRTAPTIGRVANRAGATFKVVTPSLPVSAYAAYSVLSPKSARWNDVIRLDAKATKHNGVKSTPENVDFVSSRFGSNQIPGLPFRTTKPNTNGALSSISVGVHDEYETVGADKDWYIGVAAIAADGSLASFVRAPGDVNFYRDFACGPRLSPDGTFHFYWQGIDPVGHSLQETISCYAAIQPTNHGLPTVVSSAQTVTELAPIKFTSVNYSNPPPSDSDVEIGWFHNCIVREFTGNTGPMTVYGWAVWVYKNKFYGAATAYTSTRVDTWSKSISFSDAYDVGADFSALRVEREVSGNELDTQNSGGIGANPDALYKPTIGTEANWSRTASAKMSTHHVLLNVDLYYAETTVTSSYKYGQQRIPTFSQDYSGFDQNAEYPVGIVWVYLPADPVYTAKGLAATTAGIAAYNAAAIAGATGRSISGFGSGVIDHLDYPAETGYANRSDSIVTNLTARDYIYVDPDEGVSLCLLTTVSHTKTNSQTTILGTSEMPGTWASASTDIRIEYVLNVRDTQTIIPVYHNPSAWGPDITFGHVEEFGSDGHWYQSFSGAHIPGAPEISFSPMYMSQGKCPWIAYTTLAEEAAGVTPEFYIDLKIMAVHNGTVGNVGLAQYDDVVSFLPRHLYKLFSNYLGAFSPTGVWESDIFPAPTHISMALGIANPWPQKLGAPFNGASHVTISRI
jgi:hypothetical protein